MKRILSVIIATLMLLALLAGCESGSSTNQSSTASAPAASTASAPAASTDSATEAKVLRTNGGPVEFFDQPWLNPGFMFDNKVIRYSYYL